MATEVKSFLAGAVFFFTKAGLELAEKPILPYDTIIEKRFSKSFVKFDQHLLIGTCNEGFGELSAHFYIERCENIYEFYKLRFLKTRLSPCQ